MNNEERHNQELPEVEPIELLPHNAHHFLREGMVESYEGLDPLVARENTSLPVEEVPLGEHPKEEHPKEYELLTVSVPTASGKEFIEYKNTSLPVPPTRSPRVASSEYASGTPSATEPTGTEVEVEEQHSIKRQRSTTSEQRTQRRSKRVSGAAVAGGALGVTGTVIAGGAGATIAYVLLFA